MCLFNFFKSRRKSVSTKQPLSFLIDYGASFTCSYNKKRHLVIYGSICNDSDKPVEIRTRIFPKGKLVKNTARPIVKKVPGNSIVYGSYPQMIVSATITDAPYSIAASSTESFTLIVVDFNMYDKMEISMSYEGGTLNVPIDPNGFAAKQI